MSKYELFSKQSVQDNKSPPSTLSQQCRQGDMATPGYRAKEDLDIPGYGAKEDMDPPGYRAKEDNQGLASTCTHHATAKALLEGG